MYTYVCFFVCFTNPATYANYLKIMHKQANKIASTEKQFYS